MTSPTHTSGSPDTCQASLTTDDGFDALLADLQSILSQAAPLRRLQLLSALNAQVIEAFAVAGPAARDRGATWQQIGDAAGITRQSAQQKWAKRGEDEPHTPQVPVAEHHQQRRKPAVTKRRRLVKVSVPRTPISATFEVTDVSEPIPRDTTRLSVRSLWTSMRQRRSEGAPLSSCWTAGGQGSSGRTAGGAVEP